MRFATSNRGLISVETGKYLSNCIYQSTFCFSQGEAEKNEINLRRHMQDFFKDTGKRPKPKQIEKQEDDEENEAGRGGRAVTPGR